jgi:capsid protein
MVFCCSYVISLSKGRSSLFYKARQLKKQKLILDTWTRDGNIFVKALDSTVKVCSRENQLPITFALKTSVPKPFKTGQKPNEQD